MIVFLNFPGGANNLNTWDLKILRTPKQPLKDIVRVRCYCEKNYQRNLQLLALKTEEVDYEPVNGGSP